MAESLGRAVLALETDASGLSRGLGQAEKQTSGWLGRISGAFKRLSSSSLGGALMQGLGLGAGITTFQMLGQAIAGATSYLTDGIQLASDLNEEIDKSRVVFGDHAADLGLWADGAADSLGLTKAEALGAAGAFGNMFNTIGLAQGESAAMSQSMVQLAADMASFNNEDPSEMLDRLRSGLAGEAEPLRRFGVLISEARVKAKAYEMGLAEVGEELTEQEKVQARYALILEDTAIQQGNFAMTSENFANQQRRVGARMEELQTRIGQGLLPIFEALQVVLLNVVMPALDIVISAFGLLGDLISVAVQGWQQAFDDLTGFVGNFAMDFGEQGDRIHGIADRFGTSFQDVKDRVQKYMDETGATVEEAMTHVEGEFYDAANEIPAVMDEGMRATHQVVADRSAEIAAQWEAMADSIPQAVRDRWDDMRAAAFQMQVEYAKGLLDAQNEPKVQFEALLQLQEEMLTEAEEAAYLSGLLQDERLAAGLRDERDGVRTQASAVAQLIIDRLNTLGPAAYTAGQSIPSNIAAGIRNAQWKVLDSVSGAMPSLANGIRGYMPGSEPKNPKSPLRGITKAFGFVSTLANGILSEIGQAESVGRRLSEALVPNLTVPSLPMGGPMRLAAVGAGSSITNQWILQVDGVPKKVSSRDDALDGFDQLMRFGDRSVVR